VPGLAGTVDPVLDLTCFREGAYRAKGVPGVPGQRSREKVARTGSNGNFFDMVQDDVTVHEGWERRLRSVCVGFRSAKGEEATMPAHYPQNR
jgi:hypothetical protein